jgi:ribosome-binding factor A
MNTKRNRKIADLIHHEVAMLMKKSVSDPRLASIMITSVDLSPDLGNACIYYTLPDVSKLDAVKSALKKASGFVRHQLADRTELRYIPKIKFRYDDSIWRAEKLFSLMNNVEA